MSQNSKLRLGPNYFFYDNHICVVCLSSCNHFYSVPCQRFVIGSWCSVFPANSSLLGVSALCSLPTLRYLELVLCVPCQRFVIGSWCSVFPANASLLGVGALCIHDLNSIYCSSGNVSKWLNYAALALQLVNTSIINFVEEQRPTDLKLEWNVFTSLLVPSLTMSCWLNDRNGPQKNRVLRKIRSSEISGPYTDRVFGKIGSSERLGPQKDRVLRKILSSERLGPQKYRVLRKIEYSERYGPQKDRGFSERKGHRKNRDPRKKGSSEKYGPQKDRLLRKIGSSKILIKSIDIILWIRLY